MRPHLVHHPAYTVPLPAEHRFPMGKFAALMAHLRRAGLAEADRVVVPEPAPRAWLELAHSPAHVTAVMEQRMSAEAERRLGLDE